MLLEMERNVFFSFRERHGFISHGGTDLLPRETCLWRREKRGTDLLLVEERIYFRERHSCASLERKKRAPDLLFFIRFFS